MNGNIWKKLHCPKFKWLELRSLSTDFFKFGIIMKRLSTCSHDMLLIYLLWNTSGKIRLLEVSRNFFAECILFLILVFLNHITYVPSSRTHQNPFWIYPNSIQILNTYPISSDKVNSNFGTKCVWLSAH